MKLLAWALFLVWISYSFQGCASSAAMVEAYETAARLGFDPGQDEGCGYLNNPGLDDEDFNNWRLCAEFVASGKSCDTDSECEGIE